MFVVLDVIARRGKEGGGLESQSKTSGKLVDVLWTERRGGEGWSTGVQTMRRGSDRAELTVSSFSSLPSPPDGRKIISERCMSCESLDPRICSRGEDLPRSSLLLPILQRTWFKTRTKHEKSQPPFLFLLFLLRMLTSS